MKRPLDLCRLNGIDPICPLLTLIHYVPAKVSLMLTPQDFQKEPQCTRVSPHSLEWGWSKGFQLQSFQTLDRHCWPLLSESLAPMFFNTLPTMHLSSLQIPAKQEENWKLFPETKVCITNLVETQLWKTRLAKGPELPDHSVISWVTV